ncbi:hypothetical protein [Kitasatospora aureofaciens]
MWPPRSRASVNDPVSGALADRPTGLHHGGMTSDDAATARYAEAALAAPR